VSHQHDYDSLRDQLLSDDWTVAKPKADAEVARAGHTALPLLIELLNSTRSEVRSRAAWYLRALHDDRAVPALVRAIVSCRAENRGVGSFLWALRALDCSTQLPLIVELALTGDYEVRSHALAILQHESFRPSPDELTAARKLVAEFRTRPGLTDDDRYVITIVGAAMRTERA